MATVKDLRAQAKAAGHTGVGKLNKDALEKLLGDGQGPDAPLPPESPAGDEAVPGAIVGIPTEPEKANLNDVEKADLERVVETVRGRPTLPASPKAGIPTEPERGGVTDRDLNKRGAFATPASTGSAPRPTLTGNDGVPTEPDRGGLNALERKLSGVT